MSTRYKPLCGICKPDLDSWWENTVGGDLNIPLEPHLDFSISCSLFSYPKINVLKCALHKYYLIDVWKMLPIWDKDYT